MARDTAEKKVAAKRVAERGRTSRMKTDSAKAPESPASPPHPPAATRVFSNQGSAEDRRYPYDPRVGPRGLAPAQTQGSNPVAAIQRGVDRVRYGLSVDSEDRRRSMALQDAQRTRQPQQYQTLSLDDWIRMGRPSYGPDASMQRPGFGRPGAYTGPRMWPGRGDQTATVTVLPDGTIQREVRLRGQSPSSFFGPIG